jgi:hypothetical protein
MDGAKVACWNDGAIENTTLGDPRFLVLLGRDKLLAVSLKARPQSVYQTAVNMHILLQRWSRVEPFGQQGPPGDAVDQLTDELVPLVGFGWLWLNEASGNCKKPPVLASHRCCKVVDLARI